MKIYKIFIRSKITFLFLLFLTISPAYSQINYSGEINGQSFIATKGTLPFWMHSNQRGRVSENTNFSGWISGKTFLPVSKSTVFSAGSGLLFQDETNKLQVDELYIDFKNSWLEAVVGRKQKEELYNGLSTSNENILWSLNSRPLPGIQFSTTRPIFILPTAGIGFEASLAEYLLEEKRFVSNAHVHHKSFHLIYNPNENFWIKAGLQHFVQWAGTSELYGKQPSGFKDYLRIFLGQGGDENATVGDQINALGNNLGSYELYIYKKFPNFNMTLIYNHLFEDGSGQRLGNTPDGRYGVYIERSKNDQFINALIYEFYYTKHQSHTTSGQHIYDSYFNNGVYRSGWTYEERVIGTPFFTPNFYDDDYSHGFVKIGNNRVIAHHIGISGTAFEGLPYKFLMSYRKNYGHFRNLNDRKVVYYPTDDERGRFIIPKNVLSTYLNLNILRSFINLDLILSADLSSEGNNAAIGLHVNKIL